MAGNIFSLNGRPLRLSGLFFWSLRGKSHRIHGSREINLKNFRYSSCSPPLEKEDFVVSSAERRRHGFNPGWDYQVKTGGYRDFSSLFSFVCIRFTYSDLIGMFPTDFFVDFLHQRDRKNMASYSNALLTYKEKDWV